MLLKRIYKRNDAGELLDAAAKPVVLGEDGKPKEGAAPALLDYIELHHTGISPEQNLSRRLVEGAIAEGWMTLSRGKITLHARPEDLTYAIKRMPGHYCLHCGERIESDALGAGARAHVAEKHAGATSPDPQWPTGYLVTNAYECVLDSAQHAKYRSVGRGVGPPPEHIQALREKARAEKRRAIRG